LQTYHIHIEGRVQGVGFRPFIYALARRLSIKGKVANTLKGVHIFLNCERLTLDRLVDLIKTEAPRQSLITSIKIEEVEAKAFEKFSIIESDDKGVPDLLITPDFALCDSCREELHNHKNHRYRYPFITCTQCGPRFSIETDLPYDRARTSMNSFEMCDSCLAEYQNPEDKRFYSQTNTCPVCKISQWVATNTGIRLEIDEQETIQDICQKIEDGEIVAIKGIGGFLLMADADNEKAVARLREKKERPAKPFALMYPNMNLVQAHFEVSTYEAVELTSPRAPVILLRPRPDSPASLMLPFIAPGLDRLGVMLPYAPIFELIHKALYRPLLATSGNMRGSPITFANEQAASTLGTFASHFLLNNRDIQVPQDDSVIRYSQKHHQKIIFRRSRGMAPGFVQDGVATDFDKKVLAMGALLKSTFTIWQRGRCHVSQFLGDTTELDAQLSYERTLNHFIKLLHFTPDEIIVDKHPTYFTTHLGKEYANDLEKKARAVQHHQAHLMAVLGEHGLVRSTEKILGVVLDGTGMGNDGAIWGSEFFIYSQGDIQRINHLNYYPHILGDKMALEPRLSALSVLHGTNCDYQRIANLFTEQELDFYVRVLDHASLSTSSMGRLFDAAASLLGFCHKNTYEGEAAMYLERAAQEYCLRCKKYPQAYPFNIKRSGSINFKETIHSIMADFDAGVDRGLIAARFHSTVVGMVKQVARRAGVKSIAFSGGTMQNALLVDMLIDQLEEHFDLYFHKELSPNDECISYGQLVHYYVNTAVQTKKPKIEQTKTLT